MFLLRVFLLAYMLQGFKGLGISWSRLLVALFPVLSLVCFFVCGGGGLGIDEPQSRLLCRSP